MFDTYFQKRRYENAHHNFTNFFIWGDGYNVRWALCGDHLCLRAASGGKIFMLQPIGADKGIEKTVEQMEEYCRYRGVDFSMRGAEKFMVDILEKWRPNYFEYTSERNNFDYVYSAQDLIELKGRKYHAKKNHINKFLRTYPDYEYHPLNKEWALKCLHTLEDWYRKKEAEEDRMLSLEKKGVIKVLTNFAKLNLAGGVIVINGVVEAFTFGEALNEDTAVIHVEKANPDLSGIYTAINRDFCREAWSSMTYINREEDMGLEGLRKAKESYSPLKMIEKFDIRVKKK
ncbi:MAG: phosphatidylglycerol lysyltransferase domain-containing protein [Sporomusaceae bacterium]|nr:phosphatidylglycerol lysyltransferase domain-containing protein [Sporomusaceae bacterium]